MNKLAPVSSAIVFLLALAAPVRAQQTVILGEAESITIQVDPTYQDTLEAFQPPDLPAHQDTLEAFQPPDLPPFQDTVVVEIPGPWTCAPGWTCTEDPVVEPPPPDPEPEPEPEPVDIPPAIQNLSLSLEGDILTVTWQESLGADRYRISWGNDDTGYRAPDSVTTFSPYGVRLEGPGKHWVCVGAGSAAGFASNQCTSIILVALEPFSMTAPTPMEDGLMIQVLALATPFDDFGGAHFPATDYVATLNGVVGEYVPDQSTPCPSTSDCTPLGWYWLPAPPDGTVVVRLDGALVWSQVYDTGTP